MIKSGFIQNRYEFELKILAKYYYYKNESDLKNKIKEFCYKHIRDFNEVKLMKTINRVISFSERNSLFVLKPIMVTKAEVENIRTLNNLKVEKIAFVMLMLAKMNRKSYIAYFGDKVRAIQKYNENREEKRKELPKISFDYYVNEKINTIFKLAKVYLKKDERTMIIRSLVENGFIDLTKKCKYKINYINNKSDILLFVKNFDNIIMEYDFLIGDNIKHCEGCKKPIKVTIHNRKYCMKCWKEMQRGWDKEYQKNKRKRRVANNAPNT
jgi:hypothetical protein